MNTPYKAEQFWDRTAKYYDGVEKKDELTYSNFIEKVRKYLRVNDIVIDFGCGTGLVCNEIADQVKMIYAIDISSKMLEIASNKAVGRQIQNIEFLQTTLFDERLKPGSFDAILVVNILHLLEDPQKDIHRIYELLKPGGFIISATPCMGERPVLNSLFSVGSTIGIMPKIKSFKISELERLFIQEKFEPIETGRLKKKSPQYFTIAEKLK
ncbi:MAG: class I SAM-dependent methyltransferase [Bacteroidales bacterium]|jgi:2-polyprenyl-3-methyl-5-hydroxy-6-metoxy-1,4-benzoquinol methylase